MQNDASSRRQFLTLGFAALGTAAAYGAFRLFAHSRGSAGQPDDDLPLAGIDGTYGVSGDDFTRPHQFLQNKDGEHSPPPAQERARVVIVGGGISGLAAAWWLRQHRPVLLEQAARLGGNAKGERWQTLPFSIGAAYITEPDAESASERLLSEIGMLDAARSEGADADATVVKDGQFVDGFWSGATDPASANACKEARALFKKIYDERFPDIPRTDDSALSGAEMDALDRVSFRSWLGRELKSVPPDLALLLRSYCWSSFAGDDDELSAAQVLNFLTSDLNGIRVFPGGNSAIAQRLAEKTRAAIGRDQFRTRCLVSDVRPGNNGVHVTYLDAEGARRCISADACIFAAPKFVAHRVLSTLKTQHDAQFAAMRQLKYRAYVVANVLLKRRIASPCYELFHLRPALEDSIAAQNVEFTDLVFGGWAAHDAAPVSALTLYKAFPFDAGRPRLFANGAMDDERGKFEAVLPEIVRLLKLNESDVAGLRLARWGHALPLAQKGLLANGTAAAAAATIDGRIFFANQDNWANPCFETAIGAADQCAKAVDALIGV
jgi:predicted NAD/FAD-binding protein